MLICGQLIHDIGDKKGFPGDSDGKESICNVGDLGWEDPRRRTWQPTPVFLPGES